MDLAEARRAQDMPGDAQRAIDQHDSCLPADSDAVDVRDLGEISGEPHGVASTALLQNDCCGSGSMDSFGACEEVQEHVCVPICISGCRLPC